ncbi:MAG: hypothetical protein RLZZ116_481 [Planctomycetota bacterium]
MRRCNNAYDKPYHPPMALAAKSTPSSVDHPTSGSALPIAFRALEPVLRRLRAAVKAALDTRPRAKSGARACAREFGFDKSIGWKIFQIGYGDDALAVLGAIPGTRGWEIVISKLQFQRVAEPVISEIQSALAAFEAELASRRIDRSTLADMAAASSVNTDGARQMLRIRKQATDAMAVIFGVHANARVGGYICMIGASAGMVEVEAITMIEGLERRRPGAAWVAHEPMRGGRGPLDPQTACVLLSDYSSKGLKASELAARPGSTSVFEFRERAADRSDALLACFSEAASGVSAAGGISIPIAMPTAVCVFDVFLPEELTRKGTLRVELLAGISAGEDGLQPIPIETRVSQPNSLHLEDLSAQANSSYAAACGQGASRRGKDLNHFTCHRVTIPHPPVPCTIRISWDA